MPFLFLPLLACNEADYGYRATGGADGLAPMLVLDPMEVNFGAIAEGESTTAVVTLTNAGDALLNIADGRIEGATDYSLVSALPDTLAPGASAEVTLAFSPHTTRTSAKFLVQSDDPASPTTTALLLGDGLYPLLRVNPDPYYLGSAYPNCGRNGSVQLVNVGTAPLHVEGAVVTGAGYTLVDPPPFPLTIQPREQTPLSLHFVGGDLGAMPGLLYLTSDDPGGIRQTPLQTIVEVAPGEYSDHFRQPSGPWESTDIFVYVDESGSMYDDQATLARNFQDFADLLDAVLTDWRVMVSTNDDGCHNGDILSAHSENAAADFKKMVSTGGGNLTEAGLTITDRAFAAAEHGGCNEGFLREEAKAIAVLVSDEPEQSPSAWDKVTERILATAPTTSIVSIVGLLPRGCQTALPGYGYLEAAAYTGGDALSICAEDWGQYFQEVVSLGTEAPRDRIVLSWVPNLSSLVVTVDGAQVKNWRFDREANAVIFNAGAVPPGGSWVQADYNVDENCAE